MISLEFLFFILKLKFFFYQKALERFGVV